MMMKRARVETGDDGVGEMEEEVLVMTMMGLLVVVVVV